MRVFRPLRQIGSYKKMCFVLIDSILTQHQPEEADQGITSPVVFFPDFSL